MSTLFADTFYYLAILSKDDAAHQRAVELSDSRAEATLTTAWVLTEVADGLSTPDTRAKFHRLLASLRADPKCTILPATEELFQQGIKLHRERPDKEWSLTDCISFVAMREHDIWETLTGDHHFEQGGFVALLK